MHLTKGGRVPKVSPQKVIFYLRDSSSFPTSKLQSLMRGIMYNAPLLLSPLEPCAGRDNQPKHSSTGESPKLPCRRRISSLTLMAALGTVLLRSSAAFSQNIFNYN